MRVMVLFDIPTSTAKEKKSAAKFRKFILSEGFAMEQESVYIKVCLGMPEADSTIERLRRNLPQEGNVLCFKFTEKEYARRERLLKPVRKPNEPPIGEQLTLSL